MSRPITDLSHLLEPGGVSAQRVGMSEPNRRAASSVVGRSSAFEMVGGTGSREWSHGGELGCSEKYGVEGQKGLEIDCVAQMRREEKEVKGVRTESSA